MSGFPPIRSLLPHAGPMCLLDAVVAHTPQETRCVLRAGGSAVLADARGELGAHVALEWMAQCIAAHGALHAQTTGSPPRPGLFLGSRRARLPGGRFEPEDRFEVTASLLRGSGLGPHAFACTLRDPGTETPLGEATLNVMIYESLDALRVDTGELGGGEAWR